VFAHRRTASENFSSVSPSPIRIFSFRFRDSVKSLSFGSGPRLLFQLSANRPRLEGGASTPAALCFFSEFVSGSASASRASL